MITNLQRFELDYLKTWFTSKHRKPLIIRGARQVGKSTLVKLFAQRLNLELLELDFEQTPEDAKLFASRNPKIILDLLNAKFNKKIVANKALLFLDEIQKTPEVLMCLRYFYEQMPDLPVISAGSLLDLALQDVKFSMPVGRVDYLFLGPMSFQAYLIALGENQLLEFIKNYNLGEQFPEPIHSKLLQLLKGYFIIGGLPEAIEQYVTTGDLFAVSKIQSALLQAYQEDFAKYATPAQQSRMRMIFNKAAIILGEKFKYRNISANDKSTAIKEALDNLVLARIISKINHTSANGLPLGAEVNEKVFKIYFLDIGLVSSMLDLDTLSFSDNQDLTLVNSGKIAEQFIAQHLLYSRELYKPPALYYWQREQKSSSAEIDFITAYKGQVIPIEVKAGTSGSLKSLHLFLQEKNSNLGVRFSSHRPSISQESISLAKNNKKLNYQLLSLPLYFVEELGRLVNSFFSSFF